MVDPESKKLEGIGGWLLLFILTRTILGPPWNGWRLFQRWEEMRDAAPEFAAGSEFATLHVVSWSVFGISTVIQFCVGLLLWKRLKPSSVIIAIASLWFCGLILSVGGHFLALFLIDANFEIRDFKSLVVQLISVALWTAYLMKSDRVKNTYGLTR